jgi:hypothetical protein
MTVAVADKSMISNIKMANNGLIGIPELLSRPPGDKSIR